MQTSKEHSLLHCMSKLFFLFSILSYVITSLTKVTKISSCWLVDITWTGTEVQKFKLHQKSLHPRFWFPQFGLNVPFTSLGITSFTSFRSWMHLYIEIKSQSLALVMPFAVHLKTIRHIFSMYKMQQSAVCAINRAFLALHVGGCKNRDLPTTAG